MRPKLHPHLLIFVALARLSSSADEVPPPDRAEIPAVVKALDGGVRHWKAKVEFCADYRFTQAAALTFENGVDGRFIEEFADRAISGHGMIAKTADAFRFSFMLNGRTKVARRGKSTSSNLSSFDVVVAHGIQGQYAPRQLCTDGLFIGGGVAFRRAGNGLRDRFPEVNGTVLTPITACGSERSHPFLSIVPRSIYKEAIHWDVKKPSRGQVSVTVTREGVDPSRGSRWKEVSKYTVRTDEGYPFIERLQRTHFSDGRLVGQSQMVTERLVPGGKSCKVPSRIVSGRMVFGRSLRPRVPYDFWWVTIWESDDIGRREPTGDDFVLAVAEGTRVKGLREKWRNATRFDLLQMDVSDLEDPSVRDEKPSAATASSGIETMGASSDLSFLSARVICVALIVLGGGILSYASRWRRIPRDSRS